MKIKWELPRNWKRRHKPEADHHPDHYLPELQARARRRKRRWLLAGSILFMFLVLVGVAGFITHSRFFQVREVEVSGNQKTETQQILAFMHGEALKGAWWKEYLGFSNLLVWPDVVPADDLVSLPMLKQVKISKDWWSRKVKVAVEERKVFGVWCKDSEDTRCFWFDEDGTLIASSPQVSGSLILMVRDASTDELGTGSRILPAGGIPNAFSIFRVLADSGLNVREIRLEDRNLAEIKAYLADGPILYFSLRFPADNASAVLRSLGTNSAQFSGIQYIDFRVENRAYYK